MKKNVITTLLLSASLMLGATSAMAEQASELILGDQPTQKVNVKKSVREHVKLDLFDGVQLSEEQKSEIDNIRKEAIEKNSNGRKSMMRELREMHKQIAEITFSDDYSKEKVKDVISKNLADIESRIVDQSEVENKIFNVLTPEQKVKYKDNLKNLEERFNRFAQEKRKSFNIEAVSGEGKEYTKDTIIR